MDTPVNFHLAKWLKEKGFDRPCWSYYSSLNLNTFELRDWNNHTIGDTSMHKRNAGYYSAPTISEVIMWLYKKHKIWVSVTPLHYYPNLYEFQITSKKDGVLFSSNGTNSYKSTVKAYTIAITYILKNILP